jgi:hypothetical protein
MKNKNVKIGMRVVPFQKTAGVKDLSTSPVWKASKKDFLYVTGQEDDGLWVLDVKYVPGRPSGDFFNAKDFKRYKACDGRREYVVKFYGSDGLTVEVDVLSPNTALAIDAAENTYNGGFDIIDWCSETCYSVEVYLKK